MCELVEDAWDEGLNQEDPNCGNCAYRFHDHCQLLDIDIELDGSCLQHEWETEDED